MQQLLFEDILEISRHLQVNECLFCSKFIYLSPLFLKYGFNRILMVIDIEAIHYFCFNFLKSISHLIILNIFFEIAKPGRTFEIVSRKSTGISFYSFNFKIYKTLPKNSIDIIYFSNPLLLFRMQTKIGYIVFIEELQCLCPALW